jgi:LDH2 family malate/lactate/ureidoglycolate dehydrogenase
MPVFQVDELHPLCVALMEAAGAPPQDAAIIADHCMASLLSGEKFHGMELGTQYIPLVERGVIKPGAEIVTVKETPTTLMIDGGFNFGHVVSHEVMGRLVEKAKTSFVAAASIRNQTHVGCLIDYTSMAAAEGMVALMMTDGAWGPKFMAPYGGRERRLGINPWSMSLPSDTGGNVGFDMTSGTTSLTKVKRALDEGRPIPEGWILDRDGRPTTNPADFWDGGSMLPMGGTQAHKGYALTFIIEVLADVLSGMEFKADMSRDWPVIDGCFMAVFNVEAFRPLAEFKKDLGEMLDYVTSSAVAEGHERVYYPGQRSKLNRERQQVEGVDIPEDIWAGIVEYVERYDLHHLVPATVA